MGAGRPVPAQRLVPLKLRPAEALELVGVGLANAAWVSTRTALELARFGRRAWWWRLRLALAGAWIGASPSGVVSQEGAASGLSQEDLVYGETLPGTAFDLLERLGVGPQDVVVDLGCGRGVVPLVAGLAFGARGVGIEALGGFVERARRAVQALALPGVEFRQEDFRTGRLPQGTVYFLAGTSLEPASWSAVTRGLAAGAAPGARAASLSQPLPASDWEELGSSAMPFSWGRATVYFHRRKGRTPSPGLPSRGAARRRRKVGKAHARSTGSGVARA